MCRNEGRRRERRGGSGCLKCYNAVDWPGISLDELYASAAWPRRVHSVGEVSQPSTITRWTAWILGFLRLGEQEARAAAESRMYGGSLRVVKGVFNERADHTRSTKLPKPCRQRLSEVPAHTRHCSKHSRWPVTARPALQAGPSSPHACYVSG